jgi:predicted regulator of Ras-like GTPase activity (Roadblock/LC7/MglB family)
MKPDVHDLAQELPTLALQVGQLIYTSFRESGFTLLTSSGIPSLVQQFFIKNLVHIHWDTYHPPAPGYRAAYLYQLPSTTPGTMMGWLYHDGHDEFGRSDIPYFIAYYVPGLLNSEHLSLLLDCLQKGPKTWVDRSDYLLNGLDLINIGDIQDYRPARRGVALPLHVWEESHTLLNSQTLLNWFFPDTGLPEQLTQIEVDHSYIEPQLPPQLPSHQPIPSLPEHQVPMETQPQLENFEQDSEQDVNTNRLEVILKALVAKPIGIQGAALVSSEGQVMVAPVGINELSASMMAGTMLYLAKSTQEELKWQEIDTVSVRAPEGYVLLSNCSPNVFLLIRSGKVPMGLLEGEIGRTISKLKVVLNNEKPNPGNENTMIRFNAAIDNKMISKDLLSQDETSIETMPTGPLDLDTGVTYRGRRIN